MKSEHIEIRLSESKLEIVVDDYELFDYIEDLLTGRGFEYEFRTETIRDGRKFYKMHFGKNVDNNKLIDAIDAISQSEIQRIWELNNSETGGYVS